MRVQAVTSGANPVAIKKGIDKTCVFLVKKLKENARPVQGTDDIRVRVCSVTSGQHKPRSVCSRQDCLLLVA